ncbi:MAG TPA: hypothetical protein DIS88_08225 [Prevotella sp.]|nr:hypothetical protein [Prevotella sp.]
MVGSPGLFSNRHTPILSWVLSGPFVSLGDEIQRKGRASHRKNNIHQQIFLDHLIDNQDKFLILQGNHNK